jgi:hypothetical protein
MHLASRKRKHDSDGSDEDDMDESHEVGPPLKQHKVGPEDVTEEFVSGQESGPSFNTQTP